MVRPSEGRRETHFLLDPLCYPLIGVLGTRLPFEPREVRPGRVWLIEQRPVAGLSDEVQKAQLNEMLVDSHGPRLAALGATIGGSDEEIGDAILLPKVPPLELGYLHRP